MSKDLYGAIAADHYNDRGKEPEWRNERRGMPNRKLQEISTTPIEQLTTQGYIRQPGEHWIELPVSAPSSYQKCHLYIHPITGDRIFVKA